MTTCDCCNNIVHQVALTCQSCHCTWCHSCVEQFHHRITRHGITDYAWLKWTKQILEHGDGTQTLCVPPEDSPCCSLKQSGYLKNPLKLAELMNPGTPGRKKSSVIHDGVMILPEYEIAVAPSFRHVDIISMCKQADTNENGPLHGVIDPMVATAFAMQGKVPKQDIRLKKFVSDYKTLSIPGISKTGNQETQQVKVKWSIIPYASSCVQPEKGGTLVDPEQWSKMTLFMTKKQMRHVQKKGVDVWILLGEPKAQNADYHVLTARWLGNDIAPHCHDATFEFLTSLPSCKRWGGIQVDRRNGANGNRNTFDPSSLKKFMTQKNKCPGKSKTSVVIPREKDFVFFWKKNKEAKAGNHSIGCFAYPFPMNGFQVSIEERWFQEPNTVPPQMIDLLLEQAETKMLVHLVVKELNNQRNTRHERTIVSTTVENQECIYGEIIDVMQEKLPPKAVTEHMFLWLSIAVCKISVITGALRYHEDVASRKDKSEYHCFWEPKTLIKIPSRSGKDGTTSLPLGRGGGGPGNFVMAIVDHSFTRDALVWITDQIRRGLAPDQSVDSFLLILRLLWRQRRQEEEQRQGGQCSRHNRRQGPELPENQRQVWGPHARRFLNNRDREKRKRKRG